MWVILGIGLKYFQRLLVVLVKKKNKPESLIERDNQWLGYHSPYEGEYYVCKDLYNKHNSALLLKVSMTKGETAHLPLMLPV